MFNLVFLIMNDIGIVEYSKDETNNRITAEWFYLKENKKVTGTGIATGKLGDSFEGEYFITYYNHAGIASSSYNLVITKDQNHYELKWITDGVVKYFGVGMEINNKLYAGWRSCQEEPI